MMIFEKIAEMQQMTAGQAIAEALSLANLGAMPEGPKGQIEAIGLAQAYALISIARSLEEMNLRYKDQYINQP
jgi:hypothetical protein